ncbi:hypothetical protein CSUI_002579 [Cystoisospora suis]|uniref:Uncharacterized protein n=1 Tax=Cystoisospora suis TaxID=483139 RepID=A0A2C6L8G8_9APIC|nr:hypothetical protein CSUI_002579 [Cystoisospora suis]
MQYANTAVLLWLAVLLTRCCCTAGVPFAGSEPPAAEPIVNTADQCAAGGRGEACPGASVITQDSVAEISAEDMSTTDASSDASGLTTEETTPDMVSAEPSDETTASVIPTAPSDPATTNTVPGVAEPEPEQVAAQKLEGEETSLPTASESESPAAPPVSQFPGGADGSAVRGQDGAVELRSTSAAGPQAEEPEEKETEDETAGAESVTTEPAKGGEGPVSSTTPLPVALQTNQASLSNGLESTTSEVRKTLTPATEDSSSRFAQAEAQHYISSEVPQAYYSPTSMGTALTDTVFRGYEPEFVAQQEFVAAPRFDMEVAYEETFPSNSFRMPSMSPITTSRFSPSFRPHHQSPYMPIQHERDGWSFSSDFFPADASLPSSSLSSPAAMAPFTQVHSPHTIDEPLHRSVYAGIVQAPRDLMDFGTPAGAFDIGADVYGFESAYSAPFDSNILV